MINDWEELECIKDPMHKEYNELKLWLRSQTQTFGTTVSATSHPVQMLRSILGAAIHEIRDNLDQQVGMLVVEVQTYHIQVQIEDYYRTRSDDWDAMLPTDIDEMSSEECVRLMHAAKDEIAWLVNEISRLECYISIEKQMDRHGLTERRPFCGHSRGKSGSKRRLLSKTLGRMSQRAWSSKKRLPSKTAGKMSRRTWTLLSSHRRVLLRWSWTWIWIDSDDRRHFGVWWVTFGRTVVVSEILQGILVIRKARHAREIGVGGVTIVDEGC